MEKIRFLGEIACTIFLKCNFKLLCRVVATWLREEIGKLHENGYGKCTLYSKTLLEFYIFVIIFHFLYKKNHSCNRLEG